MGNSYILVYSERATILLHTCTPEVWKHRTHYKEVYFAVFLDQYFYGHQMVVAIIALTLSFPYKLDYLAYFEPL